MKITETIERECCEPQDLRVFKGERKGPAPPLLKFCAHCGQIWTIETASDGFGQEKKTLVRVAI